MNDRNTIFGARPRRNVLAIALAMGLGVTGVAYGQATTGSIFGSAPPASGETIQVTSPNGTSRTVAVDATTGRYNVAGLPVGTYTVTLIKNGDTVSSRQNVRVTVGGGVQVGFTGPSEANAQSVGAVKVVASALPAIDVTSVSSSTIITSKDLEQLPVQRSAEAIALLAPGTVQGSGYFGNAVSFGGSSVAENAYYVNGYNTGEPYRNIGGFQLPYGAIDQQQTLTGGYSAKYGRSDGGVISQIGKSGTNEWHFGAQVAWQPIFLQEGGKNTLYPNIAVPAPVNGTTFSVTNPKAGQVYQYRQPNKAWETIYSAYVGGPLIKDKLYFFVAAESSKTHGQYVQSVESLGSGAMDIYTHHATKYYGKINWNINENNVLEVTALQNRESGGDQTQGAGATYYYDYATHTRGAFVTANDQVHNNADFLIAKYTSYINDNATLSVLWGKGSFTNPVIYGNKSTLPFISRSYNQDPAIAPNPINNAQTNTVNLDPNASNGTRGLRVDFDYRLGDHDLGIGIDNMNYSAQLQGSYPSGPGYYWRYLYSSSAPGNGYYVQKRFVSFKTSMTMAQKAYYLQDIWNVTQNVQLNLGLRNDRFTNYNDLGVAFVDEKNQWEPRLGASWDVNGDSSFKIYGNVGRYYLALPDNAAERAANRSYYLLTNYTYTGIDANGIPTGLTAFKGPYSPDGEDGSPKDPKQVTAANLRPQYVDEYIIGFDKQFNENWVYGAKFSYRDMGTVIDDECSPGQIAAKMIAGGANPADFAPGGAYYDSLYGAAYCRLINPGQTSNMVVKNAVTGDYSIVPMSMKDWGFKKGPKRTIAALDLYLEHPFDGTWYGRVDYTYTDGKGNTAGQVRPDFGQADVSKTEDWDAWQLMDGADGQLMNTRKHALRIRGAYQLTPEWLVSGTALVQSGTPKECLGFFGPDATGDPTYYNSGGSGNYHWCAGKKVTPGSIGHTPWTHQLNLAVRYTPDFADKKLAFKLDIFNVLNEQHALQTDPNFIDGGPGQISNKYQQGIFFEPPRSVRLSVSYDY